MKQVIYAAVAVVLYALGNVLTEQKLKSFTPFGIMAFCYVPMVFMTFCVLGVMKLRGEPIAYPSGQAIYVAGAIAIVFFLADSFFFSAYTSNADSFTVSSIVLLFPAAASAIKFFWTGQVPNRYQLAAYGVAVIAVALAEKGNSVQSVAIK